MTDLDDNEVRRQMEDATDELMRDAMRRWFSRSQKVLMEASGARSGPDSQRDSRGSLEGRRSNGLHSIAQSATPPERDDDGSWVFHYTHYAAAFQEFGTNPHTITGSGSDGMLHFPWPDAPPEVIAMFTPGGDDEVNRDQWDGWVHFPEVDHPGNPAIGFTRDGMHEAVDYLRGKGVGVDR